MPTYAVKRVYEPRDQADGFRILVDRLWPRGMSKENAQIDLWLKEIAPSNALRKWYGHEPEKWDEFRKRYKKELDDNPQTQELIDACRGRKKITFLFGSKELHLNNAYALVEWLREKHAH